MHNSSFSVLLGFLFLVCFGVDVRCQQINLRDSTTILIIDRLPDNLETNKLATSVDSANSKQIVKFAHPIYIGRMIDPLWTDELFVSAIVNSQKPYFGFGAEFHKILRNNFATGFSYKSDFQKEKILSATFMSDGSFYQTFPSLYLNYNYLNLSDFNLINYQSIQIGPVLRKMRNRYGAILMVDNYSGKNRLGYGLLFNRDFNDNRNNLFGFKIRGLFGGKILYANKDFNCNLRLMYYPNYKIQIGAEYEKIYNYSGCFLTLRYLIPIILQK